MTFVANGSSRLVDARPFRKGGFYGEQDLRIKRESA